MWDKLQQYFTGRGLREVDLRKATMRLYYHAEKTSADAVWMIHDEALADLTKEKYGNYLATIRGIFEKQGFSAVSVLTLFVSGQIAACKEIGDGTAFWIVDGGYGRLIVYENQPEDFLGIRTVIENNVHFGGHSRNAEGAQIDLSHDNFRSESRMQSVIKEYEPIDRGAVQRVDGDRASEYRDAASRQVRYVRAKRWSRYNNVCVITIALLIINVIVFLLSDLFQMEVLYVKGQMQWKTVFEDGEYYRLFTCMFLHYGIDHLAGNMIALYAFGDMIESRMTRPRYLILYVLAGLGGSLASCFYFHYFTEMDPFSAGASGAIYGLMGAMLVMLLRYPEIRRRQYGARFGIFILYMIYSFVRAGDSVNVAAHAGGFVCGAILFLILDRKKTRRRKTWEKKVR